MPTDRSGQIVGDYTLTRMLGEGGMGQVYLARQTSLKRDVALKILRADLAADPVAVARFQAEAEAAAGLAHPHIVQVYAAGEEAGLRFIALEYVDGRTLREYLARQGPPSLADGLAMLRQVAEALKRAADAGVVHRDIKPDNVLLTRSGAVKVADFGLSRVAPADGVPLNLTQTGMTLGTPLYMSPEQVRGAAVDHRSDLYSLGVTAYHLFAGSPPFSGATAFEVALQHVQAAPPDLQVARPDLPAGLCAVVARLLAKAPGDRYQSAADLLADLELVAAGGSLPAAARPRRWPGRLAVAAAVAAALILGWRSAAPPRQTPGGGLPAVTLPDRVVTAREQELRAKVADRGTKPADHASLMLDLALLLLAEGRADEADGVFRDLDAEPRGATGRFPAKAVAALGRATTLAYRGQPQKCVDDLALAANRGGPASRAVDAALLTRPDLAAAVAAAVDRAAAALGPGPALDQVEWLRTPAGVLKGGP